jgi:hypothetical protein
MMCIGSLLQPPTLPGKSKPRAGQLGVKIGDPQFSSPWGNPKTKGFQYVEKYVSIPKWLEMV